ncbi:MAG: CoA pyrophosphatase [Betaproteobacteria bacterium]|nr:CoA pyrophosphatase [Betaproteobacteria bacterium]
MPIDAEALRRRFARAELPRDTIYGDQGVRLDAAELTPASVLVPIVLRDAGLTVLFTRRTEHLKNHSGQISFPGGRAEPEDPGPEHTALRETQEEIGLADERIELLGRLGDYHTRTGYRITPVVGLVTPPFELRPDPYEVEEIFEVPLPFLLDPGNHQRHAREFKGDIRHFFAIPWFGYYIWGATA